MPIIIKIHDDGEETKLQVICPECQRHIIIGEEDVFCPLCFKEIEQTNINAWEEFSTSNKKDKKNLHVSSETLSALMTNMVDSFTAERHKAEPYKEMFKAGSTFASLLSHLEMKCMESILDAFDIYKNKLNGDGHSNEAFEFFLALPYLSFKLEKHIEKEEGFVCCVDKNFYLLSEELKRITGADHDK